MKILNVWFGNEEEAFHEGRLSKGLNIVYSHGLNNRGKTVVVQAVFFALGSPSMFPYGFDSEKKNYYVIEISINDKQFVICRRKDSFVIRDKYGNINICSSESDFKRYYSENISPLPSISKDGRQSLVYLSLFNQLFFLGQDAKDTSSLYNLSFFNKNDFKNMLCSIKGFSDTYESEDTQTIEKSILCIKEQKKALIGKNKILTNKKVAASLVSYTANKKEIDLKLKNLEEIKANISALKKERNRLFSRKTKNEMLIEELNGLNRTISEGKIYCLDCKSTNIGFQLPNEGISFEVSDGDTQKQILRNIDRRIEVLTEDIQRVDRDIIEAQRLLGELLDDPEITMENLIFSKNDILDARPIDEEIMALDDNLTQLSGQLFQTRTAEVSNKQGKDNFLRDLTKLLNSTFHKLNFDGNPKDVELFTSRGEVVSGSESAAFFLAKFYAIQRMTEHNHPIIIDDFREKELATAKEKIALELYKELPNQIIFTCTLKDQETSKYNDLKYVNQVDYTCLPDSHIMNQNDVLKLREVLNSLAICI
jgi:hypothetical protein